MKIARRKFLQLTGAAGLLILTRIGRAQAYPVRAVRIAVGFLAGSTTDIVARLLAQWLQDRLGQPFIVENRPGAGGTLATELAVGAPPDGYTLLMTNSALAINAALDHNQRFDIRRDIAPIGAIVAVPNVMVVNPSVSATTVPQFIAYAKANPGKLNMGSAGTGSSGHLAGELFKMMAGVDLVHVPYRGSPAALSDLLAGQVQVYFAPMPPAIEHIRAGKLRALAVTTPTRWAALPQVPAVAEFVPGYEADTWSGLAAPANTSAGVIDVLNMELNAALADPKIKSTLADMGGLVLGGSPDDAAKLLSEEIEKWTKVVTHAGLKQQ
jgi:tripartite-type tricarboxylate transporter receptor subunit TctC